MAGPHRRVFLVDNGSRRPAATLNLRRLASRVSERTGVAVEPVSMQHADRVSADELDGTPASTFAATARAAAEDGTEEIIVLPLFFGPTRALTSFLSARVAELREQYPGFCVRVTKPLVDVEGPIDLRVARAIHDGVGELVTADERPAVTVVDHGSPIPEVTAIRNLVAGQVSALLGDRVSHVVPASMERRDGDEYRFNEPLLERLLGRPGFDEGTVVIAMLFLSPGRHAGPDGDIRGICRDAEARYPGLQTRITPLVAEHESVIDILSDRLREGLEGTELLFRPAV